MATPYSKDLRLKIIAASAQGLKTKQIAEVFSVSRSWVRRVKQRHREHGEVEARPMGGSHPRIDRQRLEDLVGQQPDATLEELREQLGIVCSISGVDTALRAMNITFKKRQSMLRSRTVLMSLNVARHGRNDSVHKARVDGFSSTRRGPKQI